MEEHSLEDAGGAGGGFAKRVEECGTRRANSGCLVCWLTAWRRCKRLLRRDVTRRFSRMDGERYLENHETAG